MDNNINLKKEPYWNVESYSLILLTLRDTINQKLKKLKNLKQDIVINRLICRLEKILAYREEVSKEIRPLFEKYTSLKQFFDYLTGTLCDNDDIAHEDCENDQNNLIFDLLYLCFTIDYNDKAILDDHIEEFLREYKEENLNNEFQEYNLTMLDGILKLFNDVSLSGNQKLLFINFYIDRSNMFDLIKKFQAEVIDIGKKYFYLVEDEFDDYCKTIIEDKEIKKKISKYLSIENKESINSVFYISVGFYNSLSLRNIDDKYVYLIGMSIFDMVKVKTMNMDEGVVSDLKIIADMTRFNILRILMKREMFLQEISKKLELTPATISHHINLLLNSEYICAKVNTEKSKRVYYAVNKNKIENMIDILQELIK